MRTRLLLTFLVLLLAGAGCASRPADSGSFIQGVLNAVLPDDFKGPAQFSHANQYFTIDVTAGGLAKVNGRWTYTWLEYDRKSHFPIFSGLTWGSTGKVRLGERKEGK
jgi:hypothetical protein